MRLPQSHQLQEKQEEDEREADLGRDPDEPDRRWCGDECETHVDRHEQELGEDDHPDLPEQAPSPRRGAVVAILERRGSFIHAGS